VGGIAICGSEKTIVFRDNEEPPALTYPIGGSGAIVSDQMDDEGREFLVRDFRNFLLFMIISAPPNVATDLLQLFRISARFLRRKVKWWCLSFDRGLLWWSCR
jgi:hypothetical protein